MAIYHASVKIIGRSTGRSAVASAAYRAAERMTNERDGVTHDYTRKRNVRHVEILTPEGAPEWMKDRARLWNEIERVERRKDSQLARELELALPRELTLEQQIDLVREYLKRFTDAGMVADLAIHEPVAGDGKPQPHVHVMLTMRHIDGDGFGRRATEWNPEFGGRGFVKGKSPLMEIRESWEDAVNAALARAGRRERVDARSYKARGCDFQPQTQQGPAAAGAEARAKAGRGPKPDRQRLGEVEAAFNARSIRLNPSSIAGDLARQQSVFTRADLARRLHGLVADEDFAACLAVCEAAAVCIRPAGRDENGRPTQALYSTQEQIDLEAALARRAVAMARRRGPSSAAAYAAAALRISAREKGFELSDEQKAAVAHLTGSERLAILVGRAGAGKTTAMRAASLAWRSSGSRVLGLAVAAKAAATLGKEAGIDHLTIRQILYRLEKGKLRLSANDVLLIDEASMVSSRDLKQLLEAADAAGAKLVLVGDPVQLQSVEAGGVLNYLVRKCGCAVMEDIRRQHSRAHREASKALARGEVAEALAVYESEGAIRRPDLRLDAVMEIVNEYVRAVRDGEEPPLVIAHARVDVATLNLAIRRALKEAGMLGSAVLFDGREFFKGDRIVFRANNAELGVKNGDEGKILGRDAEGLIVQIGSRVIRVHDSQYRDIELGYASTVHRAQGATADSVLVLAGATWNRNLAYVALTRHRSRVRIFADRQTFPQDGDLLRAASRAGSHGTTLDFLDPLEPTQRPRTGPRQTHRPHTQPPPPHDRPRRGSASTMEPS